ncbi:lytic transglycosylase domain-containing protein [Fibrella aquatica]|uniref:lytic transglycosylase domain-containing protein n=1 Tax=Fibrella aquatica TaxID=3242487 RepID=UPI0035202387
MLKKIGFSLLMAFARPAAVTATKINTAPLAPQKNTRDQPTLLVVNNPAATLTRPAWPNGSSLLPTDVEFPLLDVDFCGEVMPFEQADVVSRWKHVFTLFRPQSPKIDALQKRADSFFPMVDSTLAAYDIPADFKYIPLAESGLKPRAVSPKGAGGYWQLMPATARELGLKVGGKNDERFNAQKATVAACKYLRKLYAQFGSWSLVAAAYNVGPGYMKAQLKKQADCSYYQMKLPRETRYYLFRVLLYKEILSRPTDYTAYLTGV